MTTGRRACTQDTRAEAAGVELDDKGNVIVGNFLKTTSPAIRAIGDVKGCQQFTYISG